MAPGPEDLVDADPTERPSPAFRSRARAGGIAFWMGESWRLLRSRIAMQAAAFAGANLLVAGLAVVSTAMLTRHLRTSDFGSYAFATSFFAFVALFFEFGLFLPAAREAAVASRQVRQEIAGAALVAYLPVGLAFSATIFGLSFWIDRWFHVDAGYALRIAAPAALVFPFLYVLQQLAQGVDRLHVASLAAVVAQL